MSDEERKCPDCGIVLKPGASRCPECGAEVGTDDAFHYAPTDKYPSEPPGTLDVVKDSAPAGDYAPPAEAGERFGRYRLIKELGRGGMGIVYKAFDPELKRTVALKMLLGEESGIDEQQVERFVREARAAAKLKHPGIVQIHDFGEEGGRHFFTMDYVEGISLEQAIADRDTHGLSPRRICEIIRDMAEALAYAHAEGLVHRDIKPGNILLAPDGRPYLTDFGLAKEVKGLEKSLTLTGMIVGTPFYMSPEQASGEREFDERSDVFSLGAVMYEALTGRRPFVGSQIYDVLDRVIHRDPPPPRSVSRLVHRDIQTICMKCLEKERHRRYQTAGDLAADLKRYLDGEPIHARPSGFITKILKKARRNKLAAAMMLIGIAAVVTLASWYWYQSVLRERAREIRARASAALERGKHSRTADEKLKACDDALKIDPTFGLAWQEKGYIYRALEDTDKAFDCFTKAIELSPELAYSYFERALINIAERNNIKAALPDLQKVVELDPGSYIGYFARGLLEGERGDLDAAIKYYTKCVELNPGFDWAFLNRGAAYADKKMYKEAITDYEKAIEINPYAYKPHNNLALALVELDRVEEAIEVWEDAIALAPEDNDPYYNRGNALKRLGRLTEAIEDFTLAIEVDPNHADSYCNRGNAYFQLGYYPEAIADHTKAIELRPDFGLSYLGRATVYGMLNEYEKALADYAKAEKLIPKDPAIYSNRGALHVNMGEYDKGIADFTKAGQVDPGFATAWYHRGMAREDRQEYDAAIADYTMAIEKGMKEARLYDRRAFAHAGKGDFAKAIADWSDALKLDQTFLAAWINRGLAKVNMGDLAGAISDYTEALKLDPLSAQVYFNRGTAYLKNNQLAEAENDYTKAIRLAPEYAEAYNNRGYLRRINNNLDGALKDLDKAIELQPGFSGAYETRAKVREAKGLDRGALEDWAAVIVLVPDYPDSYYYRGMLLGRTGETELAIKHLEVFLELAPHDPRESSARAVLSTLRGR
jgi:tetratricopeptide (TPR) repeat protein